MKKFAFMLALILALGVVFTACGEKETGGLTVSNDAISQADSTTQIITGLNDESITLPATVNKIACVSPAAKIIFETLGVSDKLVDASASPDVIFVDEADAASYESSGTPLVRIPTAGSVADINALIRIAAKVAGTSGDDLISKITNVLNVAQVGSSAYSTRYRVYIDLGDGQTVGSGTYVTEILYATGLENIATFDGFGEMAEADVIAADPEFIFTVGSADAYLNNAAFAEVSAIVKGYVYEISKEDIAYGSSNVSNVVSQM
ncbi:MAG: ABC transporter substrate-binding protein, partial [Eubacteriales bacterium]